MSDDIIAFARAGFDRLDARLDRIDTRLDELTSRIGRIERSVADLHVQLAEHSIRSWPRLGREQRFVETWNAG